MGKIVFNIRKQIIKHAFGGATNNTLPFGALSLSHGPGDPVLGASVAGLPSRIPTPGKVSPVTTSGL